jgi:hypothetical protein
MPQTMINPVMPPAPAQPRRRRPPRRFVVVGGLAALVGILVGASVAGNGQAQPSAKTVHATPSVPATPAPPKTVHATPSTPAPPKTVHATPAAPQPDTATLITDWYTGSGGTELAAVQSDLEVMSFDATVGDVDATEIDGLQLAADARTALADPPPAAIARPYKRAMRLFVTAGDDAAAGDFTDATTATLQATAYINQATAEVNQVNAG